MYRIINFNMPVVLAVVSLLYLFRWIYRKIRKYDKDNVWVEYAFVIYVLGVVKFAFLPVVLMDSQRLTYLYGTKGIAPLQMVLNLIPTTQISRMIEEQRYADIILSVVLLIPMYFFLTVYFKNISGKRIVCILCGMALGIEVLQLVICMITKYAYAVCSVDDFLLYMLGVGIVMLLHYRKNRTFLS